MIAETILEEVYKNISFMCTNNNFMFVDNSNVSNMDLFNDVFTW